MKTIIAYIVISAFGMASESISEELQDKVAKKLQEGWQPYGSLTCSDTLYRASKCYQPMVKYKED